MTYTILIAAHIAVLGYWLGSELCINSTYRFVCFRDDLDFAARDAMNDHLMNIDQHVRYALVLQLVLGSLLAMELGYLPGGAAGQWAVLVFGIMWLALVEIGHRKRKERAGRSLARIDRVVRYGVALGLPLFAFLVVVNAPFWLALKTVFFAGVIACGVVIRFVLFAHFAAWSKMATNGPDAASNAIVQRTYWRATSVLGLLWLCIASVTVLAVWKPV